MDHLLRSTRIVNITGSDQQHRPRYQINCSLYLDGGMGQPDFFMLLNANG